MKKFNFFEKLWEHGRTLRRVGLVLVMCLITITQVYAGGYFSSGMWQVYGYNPSTKVNDWHWTGIGNGYECEIGVITSSTPAYTIKGVGVNTTGSDVQYVRCYWSLPEGDQDNKNLGWRNGSGDKYWDDTGLWDYTINKSATPGNYAINIWFKLNSGDKDYAENHRQIKWTIPGFYPTSADKSFGTTIPVNTESETTISYAHYGSTLTTGNCAITGTNASDFAVRSISETGVNVIFTPTTTGSKTATLTITDTYSKTFTINLSGTAVAEGTKTRLYFNDYNAHSDWSADGALYRFTCEYTSGVYTHYPMTSCGTYNYYADVELKSATPTVDRYNPSSPYQTWNSSTPASNAVSSTYPYVIAKAKNGDNYPSYATNHTFNEVSGGYIYYDNSESSISNTLYLIVGHDYDKSNGSGSTYSKTYSLSSVSNTKLYYRSLSDTWHDADFYAVVGASSDPEGDHNWGSSSLESKGTGGYTGASRDVIDLLTGNVYLGTSDGDGDALSMTKRASSAASGLNSTQTIKYSVSWDGSETYSELTSGVTGKNTPAQIQISAYKFVDGTYNSVTNSSNSQTISANQNSTVSKSVPAAYTGATTLTYSSVDTHFDWIGWYDAANGGSVVSSPYYPKTAGTVYARLRAKKYTVTYNANGGTCGTFSAQATAFTSVTLPTPSRDGCTFEGWYNSSGTKIGNAGASYTPTADITLYAHYTDNIDGKLFSYIDDCYGEVYMAYDLSGYVTSDKTGKDKTYTNVSTGVKFVIDDGQWEDKDNAISALSKLKQGTTKDSIIIPTGKYATVKISFAGYGTSNFVLQVNGEGSSYPSTALTNDPKMTDAEVASALKEITLDNQTDTLVLTSQNSGKNLYIGRVSAVITAYAITYVPGTNGTGSIAAGKKNHGSNFTLSSSKFTRDGGWVQDGWSTSDGGTKAYDLGGTYSTDAAITLYPHWTCGSASASLSNGAYTVGESALDLRTLWFSSNTTDAPAFTVTDANGTGATIGVDGYSFTATAAGTATISASQTSTTGYCDVAATSATITVSATYSVTYNKNNGSATGSVPTDDNDYTSSDSVVVQGPGSLALSGYTFVGWNTENDGSGTYCSPGARLPMSDDVTFYAVWESASSCPGSSGGKVFELSMKTNTNSKSLGLGESILFGSTYAATLTGGNVAFTDVATRSSDRDKTKAKIQKSSSKRDSVQFGGADAMMTIYLDCALAQGDVITLTSYGSKNDLSITTTPANSSTIATSSKSYTIPAESPLIGKRIIYLWRKSNDNSVYLTALTITRPASSHTITGAVSPAGYGTVSPSSISVEDGSEIDIDDDELTCDGKTLTATPTSDGVYYTYSFSSWSGTGVSDGATVSGDLTATANFTRTAVNYSLAWDKNGSGDALSGTYDSGTTAYGTSIAKPNDPTWAGHTFSKWNSADDGSGDDYSGTMPAAHTTYYAQWTANKYNVAFTLSNAAYSSGTDEGDNVATCGTDYEVVFAATSGYVFPSDITVTIGASSTTKGTQYAWDASTGALTVYGSYIVGNIDISITAEAEVTTYSVTYDGDEPTSGSAPSGGSDYEGGETIVVADDNNMSKDDYTFRGWSDGTTFFLPGQSFTMPTDNVTLTAVWEPTSSGGGGSTIYKFQVKTGLGSSASNIDKSVTDASTYMSVLEGGTIPMSLSGNGNIQTKNDSALCLHSTSGLLKPTLTSPKEIQRGDIIKYRSTSNEIRLMVSTTYTATTDVTMPAGNKMVVTSSSMIGQSALNMTQKSSDAEIKYFEIYRPGEVLFYAEVNNGIGTGNIGSGTDETEQTAGAVASGHKLSYISGGKLYTKARSAGYVKGATNEIQLTDGASGTYIKVALDKALAEGDIILVNSIAQTYPLGITTSATYSTAIVGPYYVIPAESGMIGEKNIYLWRNSSNSNLRTVAVVRPGSGADTNFDVTFANGSNVDPAPSTYHWTELPDEIIGVPDGDKIVEPETEPEAVGYDFGGWYKEAACTNAWTFTSDAVTSDKTLYAKWTTNVRHFIGGVSGHEDEWGQTGNWEEGELPNRNSIVYITAPLKIVHGETPRHVGRVIIVTGGDYTPDGGEERTCTGKIDIEYNAALIVKTYVKRCADAANIADPSKYEPTAEADLHIGASPYAANGALVMVEHDGTNNAVVDFAPLSGYQEKYEDLLNQFVGTPFNDHGAVIQDYYYCWLSSVSYTYSLDGSPKLEPNWEWMNSDDGMEPFWGYDLTSYNPANSVFNMTGTLVETDNQDLPLYNRHTLSDYMENLLANSWTAPIQISAFKASDFVNADAVIYIFNSAKTDDIIGDPTEGSGVDCPGTYTCLPINLAGNRTIPSMQSFSVLATSTPAEGEASVYLDYKRLVYDPAAEGIHLEQNHAPRRNEMVATESNDAPENMKLHVKGVSTYGDYVWMVVRDDFSEGRDNGWEARMLQGTGEAPQIYTIREIGNMSIDAVNDLEGTVLGFHKGTKDDTYTFHFEYDGWQTWYLNDLKEQKSTLIDSEETYMFTSSASDTEARFVISATPINAPAVVTDVDNINDGAKARKMIINDQMYIVVDGKMYDATGKAVK